MRFPRTTNKGQMFSFGAVGLFMVTAAAVLLLSTSFAETPPIVLVFCGVFLAAWFAFAGFMASFAVRPLETVEIDRQEIRICLGKWVLRRIPTNKIKTVGLAAFQVRVNGDYPFMPQKMLVLSYKTPEQMEKKGLKTLVRVSQPPMQDVLREIGQDRHDAYRPARAYLQDKNLLNPVWLELSDAAVVQLRRCLPHATFLLY